MYPYCKVLESLSIAALLWNREHSAPMWTEAGVLCGAGHTKGRPVSGQSLYHYTVQAPGSAYKATRAEFPRSLRGHSRHALANVVGFLWSGHFVWRGALRAHTQSRAHT
ncbi:unnamed protein product [Arctogadus glacialis]